MTQSETHTHASLKRTCDIQFSLGLFIANIAVLFVFGAVYIFLLTGLAMMIDAWIERLTNDPK